MTSGHLHVVEHHSGAAGLPVVLVHGAPDRSKNFSAVLGLLADRRVIVYDRRGYGRSRNVAPAARDFADHAADLVDLLDGRRAVVVGQSIGGNVAMATAVSAPGLVAALGVWEPANAWCDWWPDPALAETARRFAATTDTLALGEQFNRSILGDDRWEALPEPTKEMLRDEGAAFRADMAAVLRAPFDFSDVKVPTVVGFGTATSSGHAEGARRLASLVRAQLYEVPGADHFAPITSPGAWAVLVRRAIALAEEERTAD